MKFKELIVDLLTSKKALAAVSSIVINLVGRIGLDLDQEAVNQVVWPLWIYILGQGIADMGKEAAKIIENPQ